MCSVFLPDGLVTFFAINQPKEKGIAVFRRPFFSSSPTAPHRHSLIQNYSGRSSADKISFNGAVRTSTGFCIDLLMGAKCAIDLRVLLL